MVKILFVGPSLAGTDYAPCDIDIHPPAAHGDMVRAVLDGATAIGLVDGLFDAVAAVWHKEILFALARGVTVLGAASMGALRAAECAHFGMQPVGVIARSYLSGAREDDADVGLVHAPAELGWLPLTEPIVDIEATLAHLGQLGLLRPGEASAILAHARSIHFSERSLEHLVPAALAERREVLLDAYESHCVRQKRRDALELVAQLAQLPDSRGQEASFVLAESPMWRRRLGQFQAEGYITAA
ncbi:TfuA-like protein [Devosia sp.]|jgi:hypothetical protein|uniref:TfuA-like protein n=1 Tax=Devosia sp. TaxID=1871048 RepID=UPI0037BE4116